MKTNIVCTIISVAVMLVFGTLFLFQLQSISRRLEDHERALKVNSEQNKLIETNIQNDYSKLIEDAAKDRAAIIKAYNETRKTTSEAINNDLEQLQRDNAKAMEEYTKLVTSLDQRTDNLEKQITNLQIAFNKKFGN